MTLMGENLLPLKEYTVTISHQGADSHDGTGFFIAPNLVLTCFHVYLQAEGEPIHIIWKGKTYRNIETIYRAKDDYSPLEDIALLKIIDDDLNAPYLIIDNNQAKRRDKLVSYGYPMSDNYGEDNPDGDITTFEVTGIGSGDLMKFKSDVVIGGMSGSPLLNEKIKKISGMITHTLDDTTDRGGRGITSVDILRQLSPVKQWEDFLRSQIKENPFQPTSGKITDRSLMFAYEKALQKIFEILNNNRIAVLIGETGMGKSSLLELVKQEAEKRLKTPRKVIYLDFSDIYEDNDFYFGICCQIGIDCSYDKPPKGYRFRKLLSEHRLLLLFDGLAKNMHWDGFTIPVRSQLRSLANDGDNSPLKIVITAEGDLNRIFIDSGRDSPFKDICSNVGLDPWREDIIGNFINHRLAYNPIQFTDVDIQELIEKSKGNPRKLMKLCYDKYKEYLK